MGHERILEALRRFDVLYPQENGESAIHQLCLQLASPTPYDLSGTDLSAYRDLSPEWRDWNKILAETRRISALIFGALESPSPVSPEEDVAEQGQSIGMQPGL
jgi:hypothetical protein